MQTAKIHQTVCKYSALQRRVKVFAVKAAETVIMLLEERVLLWGEGVVKSGMIFNLESTFGALEL